jgi:hypothetical protein
MASDDKKAKAAPAPKTEAAATTKSTASESVAKSVAKTEPKTEAKTEAKTEGSETAAAAPSNYSRGEGQKPVTAAYKENWNAIFAKKNRTKKKR